MGNYKVRFLGDKGGVIRLRYPTKIKNRSTFAGPVRMFII